MILFFYFASRLVWLAKYPIFNDESIYLRYGRVMLTVPNQAWYSLSDSGKQPLMYWLYGVAMSLIQDPLVAGRIVTVLLAAATPLACYLLGTAVAGRRAGIIAACMAILAPLLLFFDRLALVDSVLTALFAWILVVLVRFDSKHALLNGMFLGVLVGTSLWIKSTGIIFAGIALVGLMYVYKKNVLTQLLPGITGFGFMVLMVFLPLYLRPEYAHVIAMAHEYTYSLSELFTSGLGHVPGNMLNLMLVYAGYLTPVALVCIFFKRNITEKGPRILFFSWLASVGMLVIFARSVHGRYLLFTTIPVIVLTATVVSRRFWLTVITLMPMAALSIILVLNPSGFFHLYPQWRVYQSEANQYIDGWSSGYGVKEALEAVDKDRNEKPAIIATRWDSGNPEDAMYVLAPLFPGLTHRYMDRRLPQEAATVFQAATKAQVYFVTRKGQYGGFESVLTPIAQFAKPRGAETVEVFQVKPL